MAHITSSVIACNQKVISIEIGQLVLSSLLALIPVHYTYELAYNPLTQLVLEFLQEKLIGDRLPPSKNSKMSTAYCNLFRAVDCLEQKLCDGSAGEESDFANIETQPFDF